MSKHVYRAAGVLYAMKRGATLHREFRGGRECWYLSNGIGIRPDVAKEAISYASIKSRNDGLFADAGQTFFFEKA